MTPSETIRTKRDGGALPARDLRSFFRDYMAGRVTEYQMSAFLMAVHFSGLSDQELDALVDVMIDSGEVADLRDVPGVKVDKHSTGGVGDKVSLVLAPLVAALGVPVPMMSGRGLGHTGGTIDKLHAIPGFRTDLTLREYRDQIERIGCALIAQTDEVAPLDGRLYALRDVTATIESIPLIAASIMSKKLAEGIDALVLDVKQGNGAFLPGFERAESLAQTMIRIGRVRGCDVVALVTAMDRPLGCTVGNALEVDEAVQTLRGGGPADLREVTLALAAEMLVLGRAAADVTEARTRAESALRDGRALEKMRDIVLAQGGDARVLDDRTRLPQAAVRREVVAPRDGVISAMDARAIGLAAVALGAGRTRLEDTVRPEVGIVLHVRSGDAIERGQRTATVHAADDASADAAEVSLLAALDIGDETLSLLPLVSHRITAGGTEVLASP